ncbi:hypothetical protein [Candidatus Thiosymbion oneisti]|uniref:hypothetical protein n=1 Tax=Candidatus Thiosymbion oneisti TaxID=589554 RepID=UPI000B7C6B62|nr:hypothetical protein [Candidatus Thiosymbion oneisti]
MPYANIDASLSPAEVKAIKDAFETVLKKLPFLVNLTPDERRIIFKTGADSVSFVQNALSAAQTYPDILPAGFSTKGFKQDVDLFTILTELGTLAESVASEIDDTRLAVGGEAMREATQIYDYVKAATKTTPGLKPVAEQLGERFKKAHGKKQPDHQEQ